MIWKGMVKWGLRSLLGIGAIIGFILMMVYVGGLILNLIALIKDQVPHDLAVIIEAILSGFVLLVILGVMCVGVLSAAREEYNRLKEEQK